MKNKMKNKILKLFQFNNKSYLGIDNKFHTVYYIEFQTGHYYIGKHTIKNLNNDVYFCSGKLANILKDKKIPYVREVLGYYDTAQDAIYAETEILSNKEIYENEFCLNCYPGSPPDSAGTIIISKENKFKMINPKLLDYYLSIGWEKRGIKRIFLSKNDNVISVLPDEVEQYLNDGWMLGNIKTKDRIFIFNKQLNKRLFIKKKDIEQYLVNGWLIDHPHHGKLVIEKNNNFKFITKDKLKEYLTDGWIKSATTRKKIWIKKEFMLKRINVDELETYLHDGWTKNSNAHDTIYMNNRCQRNSYYTRKN